MIKWHLKFLLIYSLVSSLNLINAETLKNKVPAPKKVPVTFEAHGVKRVDNYYWMRDDTRKDSEVISHLESENQYLENWFESGPDLRDALFEEITDRIPKRKIQFRFGLKITNILEGMNQEMSMGFTLEEKIRMQKNLF